MNKMDGSELSVYKTLAIQVGQSKTEGINGKKSKYAVFFVKNKKSRNCKVRRLTFFEEDEPNLIEGLLQYKASENKNAEGRYDVDLKALKGSDDPDLMDGLWEFPGMQVQQYKLRKGMCYMNNADGKRVQTKGGEPIIADTINVLVQIDYIIQDGDKLKTVYFDGFDPDTQGQRMESRFFKEPVATTQVTVNPVDEEPASAADPTSEETPF